MSPTEDSYINSTKPNPYDQIIVISQKVINDSFHNMWAIAQTDDDSPLYKFKVKLRSGEYIDAQIGPPKIQLQVSTKDPMLYFMLSMSSGEMYIYTTDDPDDDSHIDWTIKDWVFAFSVTISQKILSKDSPEYKKYKERAGLPNSDFSLAQLFVDSSSTTKWNAGLSDFGDREQDFENLNYVARAQFEQFIDKWVREMSDKGCDILGFSAQAEDKSLNEYAPTFPPTSITYDVYPWHDPAQLHPRDTDNIDQNALSYLMMSDFANPPRGGMPYTGTFVDGTNATFCMSRARFWGWLLPVLQELASGMTVVPDTPYVRWVDSDHDHPFSSGMRYHIGDSASSGYAAAESGSHAWVWSHDEFYTSNTATNPNNSNDSMTLDERSYQIQGNIAFQAGKETITMTGGSTFYFNAKHSSKHNTFTDMTFTISWSLELAMASVGEGGVVIKRTNDNVIVHNSQVGDMSWNPPADSVGEEFQTGLLGSVRSTLSRLEDKLLNALANQHRLFLPAQGSFLMKDPIFNNDGDLMVQLTYNGADPPPPPPKK